MRKQRSGHVIQVSSYLGQAALPAASLYCAGKWGLEGFSESVSHEVKEFGISMTIVEPGGHRTGFASGLDIATPLPTYQDGVVAEYRRVASTSESYVGDPADVASRILEATRMAQPPLHW
jgi:short-subunit dehydrogenase